VATTVENFRPHSPSSNASTAAVGGAASGSYSLICKPVLGTQLIDRIAAMLEPVE
jgi:hypothetical protein